MGISALLFLILIKEAEKYLQNFFMRNISQFYIFSVPLSRQQPLLDLSGECLGLTEDLGLLVSFSNCSLFRHVMFNVHFPGPANFVLFVYLDVFL